MPDDAWAELADAFVDGAYATVKGRVRTYVLHGHLLDHLPARPVSVLDVGGGAAHQSLPLARLGHDVTVLDPSSTMLGRAAERLEHESGDVRERVQLVQAKGEGAVEAVGGRLFDAVLCHGVLMYLDDPGPLVEQLARCVAPGGLVSIMALNARTLAVRPALEGRWHDAMTAFAATTETGVLGTATRGDTVESLSALLGTHGIVPVDWYGVWLFTDWNELPAEGTDLDAVAAVELEASRRDPYRALSRVFHLVGRRPS